MTSIRKECFYMIPVNNKKTGTKLSEEQIQQINEVLHSNLKSEAYQCELDQIMIHCTNPLIDGGDWIKDRVTILFIRTLTPISHPLFMTCQEANQTLNLSRYHDFDSVYDTTPGVRYNNKYTGDFVQHALSVRLL
jgi:hypothetical protein